MAAKALPSPEVLRQLLRYEPETGKLFWRERGADWFRKPRDCSRWNTRYAGKEAFFTKNGDGYLAGRIHDRRYTAHRIIWAIYFGRWPENDIDHINGSRGDNRINNLREATRAENLWNKGAQSNNTSGYKGVSWIRSRKKWQAMITKCGSHHFLGYFDTRESAYEAYCRAAERLHGEFANVA